jgi:hypothetical protein
MSPEELALQAEATAKTNAKKLANAIIDVEVEEVPQVETLDGAVFTVEAKDINGSIYVAPRDFFHNEKTKADKVNPLAGQQYWVINYNGIAFTTMDKKFIDAKASSDLFEVKLKRTGQYLELVNFETISGKRNTDALLKEVKAIELDMREMTAWSNKRIAMIGALDSTSTPAINEDLRAQLMANINQ